MPKLIFIEDSNIWKDDSQALKLLKQALIDRNLTEQFPQIDVLCRDTAGLTSNNNIEKLITILDKYKDLLEKEDALELITIAFLLRKLKTRKDYYNDFKNENK